MIFDEVVEQYEKPIYSLIRRLVSDPDDAADLTQETFVAAYRAYGSFRGESSVYTWLCHIAVNKCRNRYREKARRQDHEGVSLDEFTDEPQNASLLHPDSAPATPHVALSRTELREQIERAIGSLNPDYRAPLVLRDVHGLSYQEIADVTELHIDVVRTRIARARGMLREKLGPYLEDFKE